MTTLTPIKDFDWQANNMAMQTLTCEHHPELRWLTKHPGERTLHYIGKAGGDAAGWEPECTCPISDLRVIGEVSVP